MSADKETEQLFSRQRERLRILKDVMRQYNELPKDKRKKGILSTYLKTVESTWTEYHAAHSEILRRIPEDKAREKLPYFSENEYDTTYEVYALHRGAFLDFLELFPEKQVQGVQPVPTRRAPDLDVPKFDGDVTKWVKFRDLFTATIRSNTAIMAVEKLSYLHNSLSGNAADVISNVDISSGNFAAAWKALTDWYDNPALLVSTHIRQLITLPAAKEGSLSELQRVYHDTNAIVGKLRVLEREVDSWDDWLSEMTIMRLDPRSAELWENQRGASRLPPTFDQVMVFIQSRISALERSEIATKLPSSSFSSTGSSTRTSTTTSYSNKQSQKQGANSSARSHATQKEKVRDKPQPTCACCRGQHRLMVCPEFLSKPVSQRIELVKARDRCINCLGYHASKECKSRNLCQICRQKHHSILHLGSSAQTFPGNTVATGSGDSSRVSSNTSHQVNQQPTASIAVLLATARVRVRNPSGGEIIVRALIDQGSEISFITEDLVRRLHLGRRHDGLRYSGVGATTSGRTRGVVSIVCSPRFDSPVNIDVEAYILTRLTSYRPPCKVYTADWSHLIGLTLADPQYDAGNTIDLLLGADVLAEILLEGLVKGPAATPMAQNTSLGWILSGKVMSAADTAASSHVAHAHAASLSELAATIRRFWEIEEVSEQPGELTQQDVECEEHFCTTHYRDETGRYVVRLPFRSEVKPLGDSRTAAVKSMDRMNRRFQKDSKFAESYSKFIGEYQQLNHMHEVPDDGSSGVDEFRFYLPHHGVIQTSANIEKLRVVFNGSQRTPRGISLNDVLHVGPQVQPPLASILLRWQLYPVVFGADVEKMYRQVRVHPDDCKWQRIVWQDTPDSPLTVYELDTVTYGMTPSAFLATRSLKQVGIDNAKKYPEIQKVIDNDFYVDDALSGDDDVPSTLKKMCHLQAVLMSGGFPLKKWISNSPDVLKSIPEADRASTTSIFWSSGPSHRALGIMWLPDSDDFVFVDTSGDDSKPTKRTVMSRIASLFDPLG